MASHAARPKSGIELKPDLEMAPIHRLLFPAAILALSAATTAFAAAVAASIAPRTKIIVPLYSYSEACWPELQSAAKANPTVDWIVVINPNSGPIKDAQDPSLYCIPTLRSVLSPNSILVGYVRTGYNSRALRLIKRDVETYAGWNKIKAGPNGQTVGLDGIFFDETSDTTDKRLEAFATYAKAAFSNRNIKIVSNPGTAVGSTYFSQATYVVDYESAYSDYSISNLPTSQSQLRQSVVMIHDFPSSSSTLEQVLAPLIKAQVGAVFVTDLKIAETDVYGKFGNNWQAFVKEVATLNG
ncbi:spherulation-specific family 4 protein [Sporobolomyces koalae]|uniref:spherulation-specific family 4 protein n=1 Tax=Sporobolomyces koalae TaxID=500713 RepID=UPI00317013A6